MPYKIRINNQDIIYDIKKNNRSKTMRLSIRTDASVLITMPKLLPKFMAKNFVIKQADWIFDKLAKFKNNKIPSLNNIDYHKKKAEARKIVLSKIKLLNQHYAFKYKRIAIRNQRTRWGSCSGDGNLNFNYKICFLPENLQEYIIIHELCHLREMNHGAEFWKLVGETVPDYLELRRELRKHVT